MTHGEFTEPKEQWEIGCNSWKYMLTIREAASYFNIGIKNMRRLCESNEGEFSVRCGNKYLICRPRFEAYVNQLMVRERNKNDVGLEENHGVN